MPDTNLLQTMSPNQLATLTPTHVLYELKTWGIKDFGLAMSNGVSMQSLRKCNLKAELPNRLTRIQVTFLK